jgi:hypothetical protein
VPSKDGRERLSVDLATRARYAVEHRANYGGTGQPGEVSASHLIVLLRICVPEIKQSRSWGVFQASGDIPRRDD